MKLVFCVSLFLVSTFAIGKEVKDFNKVLIEDVKKDLRHGNDAELRPSAKMPVGRSPASVSPVWIEGQEDSKIDKNVRQTGHKSW